MNAFINSKKIQFLKITKRNFTHSNKKKIFFTSSTEENLEQLRKEFRKEKLKKLQENNGAD